MKVNLKGANINVKSLGGGEFEIEFDVVDKLEFYMDMLSKLSYDDIDEFLTACQTNRFDFCKKLIEKEEKQ